MDLEEMKLQNEIQNLKPKNSNMHKEIYLRKKKFHCLTRDNSEMVMWPICGQKDARRCRQTFGREIFTIKGESAESTPFYLHEYKEQNTQIFLFLTATLTPLGEPVSH